MSESNGVIRIGRKGVKKFAFGAGDPFEVDVVVAFQGWINIDDQFRERNDNREIAVGDMAEYHRCAVEYVKGLAINQAMELPNISVAEALDFIARLREQYDAVADFFVPRSPEKRGSPDSSGAELRFSVEGS